ncbi:MAG TPA: PAS domain S-box protein [Bacillota bacterium]|nr:PAS domain S-box protein [Bacillota bacterium]
MPAAGQFFIIAEGSIPARRVNGGMYVYRSIFNAVNDAISVHDLSTGRVVDVNRRMCKMLGYTVQEARRFGIDDLMRIVEAEEPYSLQRFLNFAVKAAGGRPQLFEWPVRHRSGRRLWTEINLKRGVIGGKARLIAVVRDISERKKAEEALRASEAELRRITENTHDVISRVNREGIFEYISPSTRRITGFLPEENIGRSIFELVHPDDLDRVLEAYETAVKNLSSGKVEYRYRHKDGHYVWFETTGNLLFDEKGEIAGAIFVGRDITARKEAEEKLRAANRQLLNVIEFLPDATFVIDREKKVIAWNRAIEEITGVKKEDMLGRGDYAYAVPFYGVRRPILIDLVFMDDEEIRRKYDYVKREGDTFYAEVLIPALLGRETFLSGKASPLYDGKGNVIGAIESIRDTTERKRTEERLRYLSLHDPLTGVYNRTYFEGELRRVDDGRFNPVSIVIWDVDGLKLVNDTLGHDAGDSLLMAAGKVIKDSFRDAGIVARIGGDEFAVIITKCEEEFVERACCQVKEEMEKYNKANPELPLSVSAGFATRHDSSRRLSDLFKEADNNMYREKLHRSRTARSAVVYTLKKALGERDFITGGHAERMQELVTALAGALDLPERRMADLRLLAQFHDIGKVGIPDRILFKPGALTREEYMEMQRHCEIGHRIAMSSPDLVPIADWILKHHEWWNGGGYPLGLKEEEIPLECRILAVADAYDAMTSERPYRAAMPAEAALAELKRFSGRQFDPKLVELFFDFMSGKIAGRL